MKIATLIVFFFVVIFSNARSDESQSLWKALTTSQQEVLQSGKQLLTTEEVPHAIWPRFRIYRLVTAAPRDVEAVFWDVLDDTNYVPECTKVTVDDRPAFNIVDATYYLNVPFLPQEISKVRTEVTLLPRGIYNNTWTVVSSTYSQSGAGSFLIVPHHQGSLVCYTNFVVPKSSIACLLRNQAESQIKATVKAIAQRVEYQLKKDHQHHAEQIKQLDAALRKSN